MIFAKQNDPAGEVVCSLLEDLMRSKSSLLVDLAYRVPAGY